MAVTTNFSFLKLVGADSAGYTTINSLIDSIDAILNARIPASAAAASVIGRSGATAGATAAIVALTDGHVLRRTSGSVGFGTIPQSSISDFVFTNEAARDAAIPVPTEGMRAYLTAPTIPAATGSVTSIPTGVQTVYNGSVWVCLTEVASTSVTLSGPIGSGSTFLPKWTTHTGDQTNNAVTLVTGTTAVVEMGGVIWDQIGAGGTSLGVNVTGATTQAASDAYSVATACPAIATPYTGGLAGTVIFTGLTAGTNTFTLTMKNSTTLSLARRFISVRGIA